MKIVSDWKRSSFVKKIFDAEYYLRSNADVKASNFTPLRHYMNYGAREWRSPNLFFDSAYYMGSVENASDFRADPLLFDPIVHYLTLGEQAGRRPHPLFDPSWYLRRYDDVRASGWSPLLHFLAWGIREGRDIGPDFDVSWYANKYNLPIVGGTHPAVHFLTQTEWDLYDPTPNFSSSWYVEEYSNTLTSVEIPYLQFLKSGRAHGRKPLPLILNGDRRYSDEVIAVNLDCLASLQLEAVDSFSSSPLLKLAISAAKHDGYLSLDIWDTLLHRNCHPDEIKLQSARYLFLRANGDLRQAFNSVRELYRARIVAENAAAPNQEHEFRLEDALQLWVSRVLVKSSTADKLKSYVADLLTFELDAEMRSTWLNSGIVEVVKQARKPIVLISDFYASSKFLTELLSRHDVRDVYCKLYVSSDSYETKRSGALFERVLKELDIEASELLHIGDNPHADVDVPSSLGIKTHLYENRQIVEGNISRNAALNDWLSGSGNIHNMRILSLLESLAAKQVHQDNSEDANLRSVGIRLSLLPFSYVLSILEAAVKTGQETVYYFTREGAFFQSVHNVIALENPFGLALPQAELLEVSRRATFAASLDGFTTAELMRLWSMYGKQSLKALAISLNLDVDRIKAVAAELGVDFDKPVVRPWEDDCFRRVLADNRVIRLAEGAITSQREALNAYLSQKQFDGSRRLTVADIGWRGTIQDNLARVTKARISGHYLALFPFLVGQSEGSVKNGWLSDANQAGDWQLPDQVAPLEMIFNTEGGSVIGYRFDGDRTVPVVETDESEEQAVIRLRPLRAGMLQGVRILAEYARLHGLMAEDFRNLSRGTAHSLIANPPAVLADVFSGLVHNETFGTGNFETMGTAEIDVLDRSSASSAELHCSLSEWLQQSRWEPAVVLSTKTRKWWSTTSEANRRAAPLQFTKALRKNVPGLRNEQLSVFVPGVLQASGGHRTIFNAIRKLEKLGLSPVVYLDGEGEGLNFVEEYLAGTRARIHTRWIPDTSALVAFATIASSAAFVRQRIYSSNKFYLVQDAEAVFNPVGDAYVTSENSYAQGLNHLTVGNWLTHMIRTQFDSAANPVGLGVDTAVYRPDPTVPREDIICVLWQPEKPRRGSQLALQALSIFKERNPHVQIVFYGSDQPAATTLDHVQLGQISDLQELNRLYTKCKAGLCLSLSNPSRIPFEMMAAGCVPVDLYRYNNLFDNDAHSSVLAYQDAHSIARALEVAVEFSDSVDYIDAMTKRARTRTLDWETDCIAAHVAATIDGASFDYMAAPKITYLRPPIIDTFSDQKAAQAFCNWQLKLAGMVS